MKRRITIVILGRCLLALMLVIAARAYAQAPVEQNTTVTLLNRKGEPVDALTDGDRLSLRVQLGRAVAQPTTVTFGLSGASRRVGACTIASGANSCTTEALISLGWYWSDERRPLTRRTIEALVEQTTIGTAGIRVAPRPVVLMHGFISSAATWSEYTRPDGFLSSLGLSGYAVGDGSAPGVMRTGDIEHPTQVTNSISENAAILAQYIGGIKRLTGAEQVDLVAHSLGGLIARYYIDRLMLERDVAQLLMLGTSHGGSPCAQLPAALGWYLPAALELRPAYASEIFNRQITRRRGVPFHQLAGTSIVEEFKSPCTVVPSDLVVDRGSVSTIAAPVVELPELHTGLTESASVFNSFIGPRLQTGPGLFDSEPDPPLPRTAARELQFTKLSSGTIAAGESRELTIDLDQVSVASFALFDPTRSLDVQVRGASGAAITLDPATNGMVVVEDPSALFNLGYGFNNPAPGPWKITLSSTRATPRQGAPFALSTRVVGGATLHARIDQTVPRVHQAVMLTADLELTASQPSTTTIEAVVRAPDGTVERHALSGAQAAKHATLIPNQTGIYTIDLRAIATAEDGSPVERSVFLAFEAQPSPGIGRRSLAVMLAGTIAPLLGLALWLVYRRRAKSALRSANERE